MTPTLRNIFNQILRVDGAGSGLDADKLDGLDSTAFALSGDSSLPVADTTAVVKGSVDATKLLRFEVDGFTTGTTRVVTFPDANITAARIDAAQTFTGTQTFSGAIVATGSLTWQGGEISLQRYTADSLYIRGQSGGGAAPTLQFQGRSSTTVGREASAIANSWIDSTDATRKARVTFIAYDTAAREFLRGEASGTAPMIGFLGAAAVARPAVTGSRGGNAALASLLTQLASLGLITDSTTA